MIDDYISSCEEAIGKLYNTCNHDITKISDLITKASSSGNKVIMLGNGGSSSDAQHFVTELSCSYNYARLCVPSISLPLNIPSLTALSNDYHFEDAFSFEIDSISKKGDVVIGISTSGKSYNVIKALFRANEKGCKVVLMTGESCLNEYNDFVDVILRAPSKETSVIQILHGVCIHSICEILYERIAGGCNERETS